MSEDKFELFVTVDRNLSYQQNPEKLTLTIFVLCAIDNRRETLSLLIPKLFARLEKGDLQNVIEIS
jgi:hypothetical protein